MEPRPSVQCTSRVLRGGGRQLEALSHQPLHQSRGRQNLRSIQPCDGTCTMESVIRDEKLGLKYIGSIFRRPPGWSEGMWQYRFSKNSSTTTILACNVRCFLDKLKFARSHNQVNLPWP